MRRVVEFGRWIALVALLGSGTTAFGQDEATPPATPESPAAAPESPVANPTEEFDRLLTRWNEIQAEAKSKSEAFATASETDKTVIRGQYDELIDQLNDLLPQLRTAGVARYRAMEVPDESLVKLLLGMLINDAAAGRAVEALAMGDVLIEKRCPRELLERAASAPRLGLFAKDIVRETLTRYDEAVADDLPRIKIVTSKGEVVLELFENEAPNTVANFISLVEKKFYDGLKFHRVLAGFMAQGGCPKGDGSSGPGYTIECECFEPGHRNHFQGSLAMAHAGRNTGGSQFYLTTGRPTHLDGAHTVFGRVISGLDVVEQLQLVNPAEPNQPEPDTIVSMEVIRKRPHDYVPVTKADPAPAE